MNLRLGNMTTVCNAVKEKIDTRFNMPEAIFPPVDSESMTGLLPP